MQSQFTTRLATIVIFLSFVSCARSQTPVKPAAPIPSIAVVPFIGQAPAPGAPIKIDGDRGQFELFTLNGYTGALTWDMTTPDGSKLPVDWFTVQGKSQITGIRVGQIKAAKYDIPDGPAVAVYASGNGRAVLAAWGVSTDGKPVKIDTRIIDASITPPTPVPDPIPTPTPIPVPPGPAPAPVPSDKLRVLMIYESNAKLTMAQNTLLHGAQPIITAAGGEWRCFDQSVDPSNTAGVEQFWKDGMKRPRTALPWVIIGSPFKGGFEGAMPASLDDFAALLKKYS